MDVAVAESAAGEVTVLTPELSIWVLVSIVPNVLGLSSEKLPEPTVGGLCRGVCRTGTLAPSQSGA